MYRAILYLFAVSLFLVSCNSSEDTERLIVASKQADCVGVAPQKCLVIKRGVNQDWEFFYNGVEGFNYEPGYEYEIEVKKETVENPAADQSSIRYILVKEISKVQKELENLP